MYLVRSLRTFIGTNAERTTAGLAAFLAGDEYIETDTSNIYIHDGMAWRLNSGGGSPGGSDTQIQFNDDGVFGGDPGLVYDTATDILTISSALATGGLSLVNTNSPSFTTAMEASWYLNNSTPDSTEFGKFVFGNNGITAGFENGTVDLQTVLSGTMQSRIFVKSDSVTFNDGGQDVDFIVKGTGGAGAGAAGILKIDAALGAVQFNANYAGDLMDFRSTGITFNEAGADIDVRIEGDTATHLLVTDAGLDAVRVGTTTAGALLDIAPTGIIFNNAEADIDLRIAGDGLTNGVYWDAENGYLGVKTIPNAELHVAGNAAIVGYLNVNTTSNPPAGAAGVIHCYGLAPGFFFYEQGTTDNNLFFVYDSGLMQFQNRTDAGGFSGNPFIFDMTSADNTFRVNSSRVGIGTNPTNVSAKLEISSTTGALLLPRMTTTQRNALTAVNGMLIYNSTTGRIEAYESGSWVDL